MPFNAIIRVRVDVRETEDFAYRVCFPDLALHAANNGLAIRTVECGSSVEPAARANFVGVVDGLEFEQEVTVSSVPLERPHKGLTHKLILGNLRPSLEARYGAATFETAHPKGGDIAMRVGFDGEAAH